MQRQKQRATLIDVKREVESHKGDLIKLEAHKSKKKLYHKVGRIEAVYPSIFTVTVEAEKNRPAERLSFSALDRCCPRVPQSLPPHPSQESPE